MGHNPGYQPSQAKNDELIIQFQNNGKNILGGAFSQKFPRNKANL